MRFFERLYDNAPAKDWNASYPLGNGAIGVMVDGGLNKETLYLNDSSFWAGNGEPHHRTNDVFPKVKQLAMQEKYSEAADILWHDVYGEYAESYLPLCNMHIKRNIDSSNYSRTLNLATGIHTMKCAGAYEELFVSHVDKVLVHNIKYTKKTDTTINFDADVRYRTQMDTQDNSASICLHLQAPSHNDPVGHPTEHPVIYDENKRGMQACVRCHISTDGVTSKDGDMLVIKDATNIRILINSTTSIRDKDIEKLTLDEITRLSTADYDVIKDAHIVDYQSLYNRVSLCLGSSPLPVNMTTQMAFKKHNKNPDVATLMFNFARYLMISASREDSYAMNLQGIWNKDFKPPWSSAYTVNINIEMNYWIAEIANLSECHMPLMRQLKVLEKSGRITAKEQLHADGWCCGHNSDLYGHSELTGRISSFNPTQYALYLSGGAWLATHIFKHYEYTLDKDFLREYYYILKGAAEFYISYAMRDNASDYLVLCPSSSPENTFKYKGERNSLSKNATMDTAIARHIFNCVIQSAEILDIDKDFREKCIETRDALYPYKIGKHGELLEWYDNYSETEKTHRHISHLYGLHPDYQITPESTPELAAACLKTIKRRGNRGIGWSLAWKVNMLARLHKGDLAIKALYQKLKYYDEKKPGFNYGGCYANGFSAPPMQIDGNFGIASGIIELLLEDNDIIHILPALPTAWAKGSFKGLKAKGGYTVDCAWDNGYPTSIKVSGDGEYMDIMISGKKTNIPLNKEIKL